MKNSTRKVVILENLTSPYIHQAIIVLNDYDSSKENKIINEAERVVCEYLKKSRFIDNDVKIYSPVQKRKNSRRIKPENILMGLCIVAMTAALILIMHGA